jgi:hypothetical protein
MDEAHRDAKAAIGFTNLAPRLIKTLVDNVVMPGGKSDGRWQRDVS